MSAYDILIVGGGQGGAQAALSLRSQGFAGSVAVACGEADAPYDRTLLTKQYLSRERSLAQVQFHSRAEWREKGVELLLGGVVVSVDTASKEVSTAEGARIGYGKLIWAAGAEPRQLACEGCDLDGVHVIRSRADADALMADLGHAKDVVVIGGGYLGLEAASTLRAAGKRIVVVEAEHRLLARVTGKTMSAFYENAHKRRGVKVVTGAKAERILGQDRRVKSVLTDSGHMLAADLVLVAIGVRPIIAPLVKAGATWANGVRVDARCRTSLVDVFAIGDCAEHQNRFAGGEWVRLECVQNASEQAAVAAAVAMDQDVVYDKVPRFWSDQYDLKLLRVGLSCETDKEVVRGDPASGSFSVAYLRNGVLVALDSINNVKDHIQGRAMVARGARPDPVRLVDAQASLKAVPDLSLTT